MKTQFLRFLSLFLLSILLVTACNGTTPVVTKPELPPLEISYNLWPGYFPIEIAQKKGFFAQQGVKVKPVIYKDNYLTLVSDFSAGKYDGIAIALGNIISIIEKNPDVQIVLATDESAGADTFVVKPDIQRVADLKGKRIGTKLGDFMELFITMMLEENGLTTDDVILVNVEGEAVPTRLQSGEIQAGTTWDPYTSQATKAGAKVLLSSKQTPGLIPAVIVFRSSVVRDRPNEIQAFIRAWFQAQDYWQANPQESKVLIGQALNIKTEEVSTDGIHLYTLQDNLKAFTSGITTQSLYHTAKLYADFFIRTGGLRATPNIEKLINPSFVQQLQSRS